MDIEDRLIRIIAEASSPSAALDAAAAAIAEDEQSETCGIFLIAPEGRPVLWSRSGDGFDPTSDAAQSAVADALARVAPARVQSAGRTVLAAPLMSHARPIGALVVARGMDRPYAAAEARRLSRIASHIVGIIESVRLVELIERAAEPRPASSAPPRQPDLRERMLHGVAAAPGVAIGACVFRQLFPRNLLRVDSQGRGPSVERERIRDALQKTRNDLERLQVAIASELGEEQALVFGAHLMFANDPSLHERVEQAIAAGASASVALDRSIEEIVRRLRSVGDPYIRERIEDLEDLRSRILGHLLGALSAPAPRAQLVITSRVTPSLVVELHGHGALGIASELGGATSHGVLLARALGLPAVTGVKGLATQALVGQSMVIDGDEGTVVLAPSASTLNDYRARIEAKERARSEFVVYRDRAPVTADGVRFALQANVAFGVDIEVALENNAQGIGLYRTEFPFIVRDGIPTVDEQVRIYAKAFAAFPSGPVVLRILDLAEDKLVPAGDMEVGSNAFQGYRSIRVLFDYPHILRDQVQAFAIAAGAHRLSILIPMVTSIEELRRVKQLVGAALVQHPATIGCPPPRFGAMIEVPAAVEIARDLAREVEFLSIGTNDLTQYALVIDREDPRLASPLDAYHPAILRMVSRVVVAGHAEGKEVAVCGEIAARFELAAALLALGVDSLSVTPRAIPELKQRLSQASVRPLTLAMDRVLQLSTAAELEQALRSHLDA
jgi:phosphotransferase system, enzyme I, PtsP